MSQALGWVACMAACLPRPVAPDVCRPMQQAGIDLSLLTAVMCPIESLEEPDEPWEFDRLLQVWYLSLACREAPCCLLLHSAFFHVSLRTQDLVPGRLQEVSQALQAEADQKEAEEGGAGAGTGGSGGGGSDASSGNTLIPGKGSTVVF